MATPDPQNLDEFFEKLTRADRQRKMTKIDVTETSGVTEPAHGVSGWVVLKSADGEHDHRADAAYLDGPQLQSAQHWAKTDTMQPGQSVALSADRTLGKSACGCVYLLTPETINKAANDVWLASHQEAMTKEAGGWSPEEVAWFEAETKRIQP